MDEIASVNSDTSIQQVSLNQTNMLITLDPSQELTLTSKPKTTIKKPSFIMIGSGYIPDKKQRSYSMDYTEELLNMSKPEAFMFKLLMRNRLTPDFTKPFMKSNYTYIDMTTLTATEKQYVKLAYKQLREKDLVVRVKRGTYLINPRLVISGDSWKQEESEYQKLVSSL